MLSTSVSGRLLFCGQLSVAARPIATNNTGISSGRRLNSLATATASKPIIGHEPNPCTSAAYRSDPAPNVALRIASSRGICGLTSYRPLAAPTHPATSSGDMKPASAEGETPFQGRIVRELPAYDERYCCLAYL